MSGGSYDYIQYKLDECADSLRERHQCNAAVLALADHLNKLGEVMHAIEWADSGDTAWNDNDARIAALLGHAAVLQAAVAQAEAAREALTNALDAAMREGASDGE